MGGQAAVCLSARPPWPLETDLTYSLQGAGGQLMGEALLLDLRDNREEGLEGGRTGGRDRGVAVWREGER